MKRATIDAMEMAKFWLSISVDSAGCWLWRGRSRDYGKFRWKNRTRQAHVVAHEWFVGAVPPGCIVCHRCDVPGCCNPGHVFTGTHADNMRDMREKGRARGNPRPRRKLSPEAALAMRSMRQTGASIRAVAKAFGVSANLSAMVLRGERWPVERGPDVG